MLRHLMHHWERRLYQRDTNRVVRPFEWGLEFLGNGHAAHNPRQFIAEFNEEVLAASEGTEHAALTISANGRKSQIPRKRA